VTVLYTVGLLNTVRSILRKSLHVDKISSRSSAYIKTTNINASNMTTTPRGRKFTYNIINTQLWARESARVLQTIWFARLHFCRNSPQLMTSWNTAVYRYHGIFETVYYRLAFPNTGHPSPWCVSCKCYGRSQRATDDNGVTRRTVESTDICSEQRTSRSKQSTKHRKDEKQKRRKIKR